MQIINSVNEMRKVTYQPHSMPVINRISGRRLNRSLALSLSLLSLVSVLGPFSPAALAADEVKDSKVEVKDSKVEVKETKRVPKAPASEVAANAALDSISIHLINTGDWKALIERLNKQLGTDNGKSEADQLRRSYRQGWLAFAYMFNAKPEQSQALNDQVDRERVALADIKTDQDRKLYGNAMVVQAFNQIAQGKNDAAEASLQLVPECNR
ncbi:MAG: hypothetical protein C0508_18010, partial [Cyanobacteria bacterium PR.023]|nr:hypothetical protein [Cyanobacteria bacterium PR.023]